MKRLLPIAALLALFFTSCSKNELRKDPDTTQSEAVITGIDYTECGCCGGYIFSIVANPAYGRDFLTLNLPAGSGIDENTKFPVYVTMNWKMDTSYCNNRIIVTALEKK